MFSNINTTILKMFLLILILTICCGEDIPGIDATQLRRKIKDIVEDSNSLFNHDAAQADQDFHMFTPGMEKLLVSPGKNRLEIFCHSGEPPSIVSLLKTVELVVKVPDNKFRYFEGQNSSSIRNQYNAQSWFTFTSWRPSSFRLNVYNYSCVGIETEESFTVQLKVRHVDFWRVITLAIGVGLFVMAPLLAHNFFFHYITGISVGVCGSLLVIVFLISRFVPKKTGALTVLFGGWGLILYFLQYFWTYSLNLVKEHQSIFAGYVVISGLISFAVVYRWGPIVDKRSLKLVQWSLQLVALCLIFVSSQCQEFTVAIILILIINYNIPQSWKCKLKTLWLRRFPPKRKLLTEDEYMEQSRVETKKALNGLRGYCHSPDCNAWKTMSRLRTPQRFAEFVEGEFHLNDEEILSYESSFNERLRQTEEDLMTSDEEEEEILNAT